MIKLSIDVENAVQVRGADSNYATAHATCDLGVSGIFAHKIRIGQYVDSIPNPDVLYIVRGAVKFVTSTIPSNAIISRAYLRISPAADASADFDFDVGIGYYDWSAYDPYSDGNKDAIYDGILSTSVDVVWRNTAGISEDTYYNSPDLDIEWINVDGNTYFSFISSRDLAESAPSMSPDGLEYIDLDCLDANFMQLVIMYALPPATIKGIQSVTGFQSIQF